MNSYDLEKLIPAKLFKKGYSLEAIGAFEMAWKREEALQVIEILCGQGYLILGGDVYRKVGNDIVPTYDNWYIERDHEILKGAYVLKCKNKAISYIDQYWRKNGNEYYFTVVAVR